MYFHMTYCNLELLVISGARLGIDLRQGDFVGDDGCNEGEGRGRGSTSARDHGSA